MIVDLYAGAGGWEIAGRELNLEIVGIELNADACATRTAAGLTTIPAGLAQAILKSVTQEGVPQL